MEERTHDTTSLQAAAALDASGAQFLGAVPGDNGTIYFRFNDADGTLGDREGDYFAGRLDPVNPREVLGAFYRIRRDLFRVRGHRAQ